MIWKKFKESEIELPEVLVENITKGFSAATMGLVELGIEEKSDISRISRNRLGTRFQFIATLISKHLPEYSFQVFEFGYDVSLYPVRMFITKPILEELANRGETIGNITEFDNEEAFKKSVELVFDSNKFTEIVSGLMKIARKNELPF
jgi:hypothetical protein